MADRTSIGLDNPVFRGRLRQPDQVRSAVNIPPAAPLQRTPLSPSSHKRMDDIRSQRPDSQTPPYYPRPRLQLPTESRQTPIPSPITPAAPTIQVVAPQPLAQPAQARQQPSGVLNRYAVPAPPQPKVPHFSRRFRGLKKTQLGLIGMAVAVFIFGIVASVQTIKTNHQAAAQVAALTRKTNSALHTGPAEVLPSTNKPTASAIKRYIVAPNLPRYLIIPKLNVDARVMQVGVTANGDLGTPSNVYDTAWYTGSALPGQPGATLIDGHVSSWTTHGIFYSIDKLVAGDAIQIVRGDGTTFNYQVVKVQVYNASNVNMQAAMNPITQGKSGLNLITCTGDVINGTSEFNKRVIVFAQQV